eukprot:PLAT12482.26.p2 GENE.PLAT12482.26~~PLAT12482.26.p2  ORF type:complete len:321 (-),score=150.85 PLAT12482.26:109-933(-)
MDAHGEFMQKIGDGIQLKRYHRHRKGHIVERSRWFWIVLGDKKRLFYARDPRGTEEPSKPPLTVALSSLTAVIAGAGTDELKEGKVDDSVAFVLKGNGDSAFHLAASSPEERDMLVSGFLALLSPAEMDLQRFMELMQPGIKLSRFSAKKKAKRTDRYFWIVINEAESRVYYSRRPKDEGAKSQSIGLRSINEVVSGCATPVLKDMEADEALAFALLGDGGNLNLQASSTLDRDVLVAGFRHLLAALRTERLTRSTGSPSPIKPARPALHMTTA